MKGCSHLAAAAILRHLDDADKERCKEYRGINLFGLLATMLLLLLAVMLLISELFVDVILDFVFIPSWNGFVIANSLAYNISPVIIIVIYAVGGGLTCWYFGLFKTSLERAHELRRKQARRDAQLADAQLLRTLTRHGHRHGHGHGAGHGAGHGGSPALTRRGTVAARPWREELRRCWETVLIRVADFSAAIHYHGSSRGRRDAAFVRERKAEMAWTEMNKHALLQAAVPATITDLQLEERVHMLSRKEPEKGGRGRKAAGAPADIAMLVVYIPPSIWAMRRKGQTLQVSPLQAPI